MSNNVDKPIRFGRVAAMLPVKDMNRACAFYAGALGFTKTIQNGDPVSFMIIMHGEAELHLTLQPDHEPAGFNITHMMVGDADALYTICQQHGLAILRPIENKEYGLRAFVFADPDGNRIDVGQPI